jgi:hypothetical protein
MLVRRVLSEIRPHVNIGRILYNSLADIAEKAIQLGLDVNADKVKERYIQKLRIDESELHSRTKDTISPGDIIKSAVKQKRYRVAEMLSESSKIDCKSISISLNI